MVYPHVYSSFAPLLCKVRVRVRVYGLCLPPCLSVPINLFSVRRELGLGLGLALGFRDYGLSAMISSQFPFVGSEG